MNDILKDLVLMADDIARSRSNLLANYFIRYLDLIPGIARSTLDFEDFLEKISVILLEFCPKIGYWPDFICQILKKWQNILDIMSNAKKTNVFNFIKVDTW